MTYTPQRCKDCGELIDEDDPDYQEEIDRSDLCGLCNLNLREKAQHD